MPAYNDNSDVVEEIFDLPEPMVDEIEGEIQSPLLDTDEIEEQEYTVNPTLNQSQTDSPEGEGQENYNPIAADPAPFAEMATETYVNLVPGILAGIMAVGEYKLVGLPKEVADFVKSGNKQIEKAFEFKPEQKKQIEKALVLYLKTAGTRPPSPLVQVLIAALIPVIGGGITAMQHRKEIDAYLIEIQTLRKNGQI